MTEERMICEKSHREINHPEHGGITEIWWCPVEPAPPKDWKEKMYKLEQRNVRLSRFIMDWLGRELPMTFIEGDHHKNKEDGTPVPPKDWKPYCFSDFDMDGKCDHDEYYMMASCDKCPFTK